MSSLFLHGFTGSPASFARLPIAEGSLVPALAGHLDAPISNSFWDEVDRLAALGSSCKQLFGYSLGGRLALGILTRHPHRFEHAVLVSGHPGLQTAEERQLRRASDQRYVRLLRDQGLAAFVSAWESEPLWSTQRALEAELLSAQRRERLSHDPERLALSLVRQGLAEMPDLRPLLARIRCAVTVLVGERDEKFTALGNELCRIIPGAQLTIAPGAGHNLLLESPQLCAAHLLEGKPS